MGASHLILCILASLSSQALGGYYCNISGYPCVWPNVAPAGNPFPQSSALGEIALLEIVNFPSINAEAWFPSWGPDGVLYSTFTDGGVETVSCQSGSGLAANTGAAIITGPSPRQLVVTPLGCIAEPANATNYIGRYPSANLFYDSVWYQGTHALGSPAGECGLWCIQGPFYGFRYSTDYGATWTLPKFNLTYNLFSQTAGLPLKIGAPRVADFGQNQEYSPDGQVYMVSSGCQHTRPDNFCSWISGDAVYLMRTTLNSSNPGQINNASTWEFWCTPGQWCTDLSRATPIIQFYNHVGSVSMAYNPWLKKYLVTISAPHNLGNTTGSFDTYILESNVLTGPYYLVTYMQEFGTQGYFVTMPSKFMDATGGWLAYSANFIGKNPVNPPNSRYSLNLLRFSFSMGNGANSTDA